MKIAIAGNPNSGKTTLFNTMTGSSAHVGNWPGVTVDKKDGVYKLYKDNNKKGELLEKLELIDLPGIYSLSPYSPEEIIARKYILEERPDAIINIVDATNLERNLYLTTQLLETDIPIVIALNFIDLVDKAGDKIDLKKLEEELGVPVVRVSALKGKGIYEIAKAAYEAGKSGVRTPFSVISASPYKDILDRAVEFYNEKGMDNALFRAVKLLEGDSVEAAHFTGIEERLEQIKGDIPQNIFDNDFEAIVADARFNYITANYSPALKRFAAEFDYTKSNKADKVLTHKVWSIPLFLLIMFAVFHLTFSSNFLFLGYLIPEGSFDIPVIGTDAINAPGTMLAELVGWGTDSLTGVISAAMPEGTWYTSLVVDGLLAGIFAVLSFVPQIITLFFFLSILEDSGYMARVAFIMDRIFRRFGLSGKALMPLVMCFGCAVPGIMATRTLENEKERRMAIILSPFFSCGAKMPIWATFGAIMFAGFYADLIVYGMYLLGIIVAILSAIILKKTALKGEAPPFILEMPPYHMPQMKNVLIRVWDKLKHYVFRAATIIAGALVVIWFLSSFSFSFRMVDDPGNSIIGQIAKVFAWLFVPLGFGQGETGWMFVVAAFTGLLAKEMVVATMGSFAGMVDDPLEMGGSELAMTPLAVLIGTISVPAAFAFMAFNLLSVPCMAAVAAANGEMPKKKHLFGAIAYWLVAAYVVSMMIYLLGMMFVDFSGFWWVLLVTLIIAAAIAVLIVLTKKGKIDWDRFFNAFKSKKKKAQLSAPTDGQTSGISAWRVDEGDDDESNKG